MIVSEEAMRVLNRHRGDAVVVTNFMTNVVWANVSECEDLDLRAGFRAAMGKASSVGLGLALARPERRVMVLDGDGSLLMNLGSLASISQSAPQNLVHILFQDNAYTATGGQPIPGAGKLDFEMIARGAGLRQCSTFDDLEELASDIGPLLLKEGPIFICLKVVTPPRPESDIFPGRPGFGDELRKVKEALEATAT